MKFKNYLAENVSVKKALEIILKDCKPFIKDYKKINKLLWSGRKNNTNIILKKTVRQDRTPLDTPLELHNFIDNWFYKKFGIKARSNAVFCKLGKSPYYGRPYIIIPVGDYTTISSDKVPDVFTNVIVSILIKEHGLETSDEFDDLNDSEKKLILKKIEQLLEKANYTKNKWGNAKEEIEIMLHCKEYYMINRDYENILVDVLSSEG